MAKLAILDGRSEPLKQKPYNSIGPEEAAAAARVLESRNLSGFVGRAGDAFLGGPCVRRLEQDYCGYFGSQHAVSFNSATTALQAAVASIGVGPGDEVITSPYTMSATATAVLLNNAIPVFADVDPETCCLDPESVRQRVTPRTKAIIAVNLFGCSADYDALIEIAKPRGIRIIEDNAQSPGATYREKLTGTIGDIGVFSLNVHKVIQCGEGGVLVTHDDKLAWRAQLVRNHGEVVLDDLIGKSEFEALAGSNYRLSEIHAAIAAEQLKKLDTLNQIRIEQAEYLTQQLAKFSWIVPCRAPMHIRHVYYLYPFTFRADTLGITRKTFAAAMNAEGFPVAEGYQKPLYLLPMYQQRRIFPRSQFPFVSKEYPTDVSYAKGICPVAERLYEESLLTTSVYQPPNTRETIGAFVDALEMIEAEAEHLREYEKKT